MSRYIYQRLLLAIPTVFGVTVLIFIAMRVLPGDPLSAIYGETSIYVLTDEELYAARESLGLNRPLPIQYLSWMVDVFKGDLGRSFWQDQPISEMVLRRGAISMEIAVLAVAISWIVGLPVGFIGATRRNSAIDYISRFVVTLWLAIPAFWMALTVITISVLYFQWRPNVVLVHLWDNPAQNLQMIIGPALVIGVGLAAPIARMGRATILEVYHHDYVRTARAKGLNERLVIWRHILKNVLIPLVTVAGLHIGHLLGGAVAVELAFGVPGLGTALVQGIEIRDWMIIQNLILIYALIFVMVNLLVDLSYGLIDPRIRYE